MWYDFRDWLAFWLIKIAKRVVINGLVWDYLDEAEKEYHWHKDRFK